MTINVKVKGRLFDTSEHEKVVIKVLQGSVVTQTESGGLTIYPRVDNFL